MALPQSYLKSFKASVAAVAALEELKQQNNRLQHDNEAMQPAATIGQAVGPLRSITVMDFARN